MLLSGFAMTVRTNILSIILFLYGFVFCSSAQTEPPLILYNDPTGNFQKAGQNIENTITDYIDKAEFSVKIAMYNFDSSTLFDALLRAKDRNVEVKIVGDDEELNSPGYQKLIKYGFNLKAGNSSGIQHNKFILIDDEIVITGTGNYTHSGFYRNDNHFIFFKNSQLWKRYDFEFNQMYYGRFSGLKTTSLEPGQLESGNAKVYFTPQENHAAMSEMISSIRSAKSEIYYMIFAFTQDEIATELLMASRRGVKIYGIHDLAFTKSPGAEAPGLYHAASDNGPFVHFDGNENTVWINGSFHGAKMHCKTMIIDPDSNSPVVITGSFNWSENALNNNDENLLVLIDKSSAKILMKQWKNAWRKSHDFSNISDEISGSIAGKHDILITEILTSGNYLNGSFVEIYNNSGHTIDLKNWLFTWEQNEGTYSWRFPSANSTFENLEINPGQYRILYGSNKLDLYKNYSDKTLLIKIPDNKNFTLSPSAFKIKLYDRKINLIDEAAASWYDLKYTIDDVVIKTSSINRRMNSAKIPYEHWYKSDRECLWSVCQTSSLAGSPGNQNEPAPPAYFQKMEYLQSNQFKVKFNGLPNYCHDPNNMILEKNNIPITINAINQTTNFNELLISANDLDDPFSVYSIYTAAFPELDSTAILVSGNKIFLGTKNGLSISVNNSPIESVNWGSYPIQINHIHNDILAGVLYFSTNNGVYISNDNGLTYQHYKTANNVNDNLVIEIKTNSTYVVALTAGGLFYSAKSNLLFIPLMPGKYSSLYFSDSMLLSGSNGYIDKWDFFPGDPSDRIEIPGEFNSLEYINNVYYAASTSGVYSSNDNGITFQKLIYPELDTTPVNQILASSTGDPLLVSPEALYEITSGINKTAFLSNSQPVSIKTVSIENGSYYASDSLGTYIGASPDQLTLVNPDLCRDLPSGKLIFNGYDPGSQNAAALLKLNEISFADSTGNDWVELRVESGGSLNGIEIDYYGSMGKTTVFEFPQWYVQKNDIIVVYFNSPNNISSKTTPISFYSSHLNPEYNDGIISIEHGDQYLDALYYSNRDGNISGDFINTILKKNFFNSNFQGSLANFYIFPVNEVNDFRVQSTAAQIPSSGNNRTIVFNSEKWINTKNPTPGIK
jgi:phosphatidylserine/phosphatidylglycerophosphate/cardiolipin synthase-like enzyme